MVKKREKKHIVKKFFAEFKKFITRGNVLDMAVGVIVGGAFTAIVNALSKSILNPLINWMLVSIFGRDSLSQVYTVLKGVYDETGALVLADSIYIDWGIFINSIINFIITAFVLFCIIKTLNGIADAHNRMIEGLDLPERKMIAKYRREGMSKKAAKMRYDLEQEKLKATKEEEERLAKEKAEQERLALQEKEEANTRLLEEIRDLLKKSMQ